MPLLTMMLHERRKKIQALGFREHRTKVHLFYNEHSFEIDGKTHTALFFADLRHTGKRHWTRLPVCYVQNKTVAPSWFENRVWRVELSRFNDGKIPFSTWHGNYEYDFSEMIEALPDGFCKRCDKEFRNEGRLCPDCHLKELTKTYESLTACEIPFCNVKIQINGGYLSKHWEELGFQEVRHGVPHHTCYARDETMNICLSCHGKITARKNERYEPYWPVDSPKDSPRKVKLIPCSDLGCDSRARIDFISHERSALCHKCKAKTKRKKQRSIRSRDSPRWYSEGEALFDKHSSF